MSTQPTVNVLHPPLRSAQRARGGGLWRSAVPERWLAIATVCCSLPLILVALRGSIEWVGRPFPGFFVMENGLVPTVSQIGWTGPAHGVPFHARVVAVDGRPTQGHSAVYAHVASLPVGTPVRYTLVKDGETFERAVPTAIFTTADYFSTLGLLVGFGTLSIVAAVAVIAIQPQQPAALAFLLHGVLVGAYALTGTALYHPDLVTLSRWHHLAQALFPAAFIHLGLTFPVTRRFVERRPAWLLVPYLFALPLAGWVYTTFYATEPQTLPLYASYLWAALAILVLVGTVSFTYWEQRTPLVRHQLHVVFPGILVGMTVALIGYLDNTRGGGQIPTNFVAISPLFYYASIGYAIARRGLFDVDAMLRQTIVYVMLTFLLVASYFVAVTAVGFVAGQGVGKSSPLFHLLLVASVALAFEPMRRRVQDVVDRTFFRNRPDFRAIVLTVSSALTSARDLDRIVAQVEETVGRSLHVKHFSVLLWLEEGTRLWRFADGVRKHSSTDPGRDFTALRDFLAARREPFELPDPALGPVEPPPEGSAIATAWAEGRSLGAVLLVPIVAADRLLGLFALGPRLSGLPLSPQDIDLLTTLAGQSSTAIQSALLAAAYERLQAAQLKLRQTDHLASLGLLVAGVAHEINNPVTFIKGNIRPAQEELDIILERAAIHRDSALTEATQEIRRMFDLMRVGAERTASIVNDLRTFSRVGGAAQIPTDLHEGIEVTLRLLKPKWADRIDIHCDFGDLPLVRAVPGQMNQVFMNVLANACEAIPNHGNVWVTTRHVGDNVAISVRDDGVGISPEDHHRIFDPFFTTKPQGKGTGLGLAISHGIVKSHEGDFDVASAPGVGTTITVTIPVNGVAEGDATA